METWKVTEGSVSSHCCFSFSVGTDSFNVCEIIGETVDDFEKNKKNAHLISAAPELLEALESLLDCKDKSPKEQGADIQKAQSVIAKARGL